MRRPTTPFLVLLYFLCIVNCKGIDDNDDHHSKVYIVYLGEKEHNDIERLTNSHYDMLTKVLGSKEAASESMVYSYRHGFSGFAAKLTESRAQELEDLAEVIQVIPSTSHKLYTTRTFHHLGLSSETPNNLLQKANLGDGMIIGIIDSGIWPESESFSDKGIGPIPSRWRGECEEGDESFDPKKHCNRKIIGARWLMRAFRASDQTYNSTANNDYESPRDGPMGHGTHIAGTAAGSFVRNVSYKGLSGGTLRGAAPMARIASYKVCWNVQGSLGCEGADILAAIDQAILDGVDVIQVSLGNADLPLYMETNKKSGIAIGAYHAILKGITVVTAAGNDGPTPGTVSNVAPWVLTVGASTIDRSFPTPIKLENHNVTLLGQAAFNGKEVGPHEIHVESSCDGIFGDGESCEELKGKLLTCFNDQPNESPLALMMRVKECGGVGVIISKTFCDITVPSAHDLPFIININYEDGNKLYRLLEANSEARVKVSPSRTVVGKAVPAAVAYFSSRGPSTSAPEILKPDIVAPGSNILAALPPGEPDQENGYGIMSGTSMAAPHVSGIVLLLKALHPDWSPAAIKSALITTARITNEFGYPLFANGNPTKQADPFDYGGGVINPNAAADPGLVYEIGKPGYINYLCAMGYRKAAISRLVEQPIKCPKKRPCLLDINLPSITIPSLRNYTTLTRTVTNVGPVNSIYKAVINPPFGTNVLVKPDVLVFSSKVKTVSFTVIVSPAQKINAGMYTFGSLTWMDGVHSVRSPISVKLEALGSYVY